MMWFIWVYTGSHNYCPGIYFYLTFFLIKYNIFILESFFTFFTSFK